VDLKKAYHDLKQSFESLEHKTDNSVNFFKDPRIGELWSLALKANLSAVELESFRVCVLHLLQIQASTIEQLWCVKVFMLLNCRDVSQPCVSAFLKCMQCTKLQIDNAGLISIIWGQTQKLPSAIKLSNFDLDNRLLKQDFTISKLKRPALMARYVRGSSYTFICIDCSRAIYCCSMKPEGRITEVQSFAVCIENNGWEDIFFGQFRNDRENIFWTVSWRSLSFATDVFVW